MYEYILYLIIQIYYLHIYAHLYMYKCMLYIYTYTKSGSGSPCYQAAEQAMASLGCGNFKRVDGCKR